MHPSGVFSFSKAAACSLQIIGFVGLTLLSMHSIIMIILDFIIMKLFLHECPLHE
jgi:hypothetical protein